MRTFTIEIKILGSKARTEIEIVRSLSTVQAIKQLQLKYGQVRFNVTKVNMTLANSK